MEVIPAIHLNKSKKKINITFEGSFGEDKSYDGRMYIFDEDGLVKNKPNFNFYQRYSSSYDLWVDAGPMATGDIVDYFMAGANAVILRMELCKKLNLLDIKEMSENEIFLGLNLLEPSKIDENVLDNIDGVIVLNNRCEIDLDCKYGNFVRELSGKYKTYVYDSEINNIEYWKKRNVTGIIVDKKYFGEFKRYES
ncbi:MAG: hypothetical protein U9O49_02020 [Candidatus Thermoplasmatota archaeon]|nr:hypothetical protein [Candidatus Thermoplasmatota archaeon]